MPSSHSTISTINPKERALLVEVEESVFAKDPYILPSPGTPYKKCNKALFSTDYNKAFNEFIYTSQQGSHGLLFAPNKQDGSNGNLPFRSTWTKFGNHRWCPILKGLSFVHDYNFPLSANIISGTDSGIATAPRNYVREIFIQEVNEGSRFLLDEFTSPFPFVIPRFPVPQPGYISYSINGVSGSFPECLHDDIEIPATPSATATLVNGTDSDVSDKVPGQFFPRTNFRRRRPYVLTADQALQNGVWYMQRLRVFPPKQPRTSVA